MITQWSTQGITNSINKEISKNRKIFDRWDYRYKRDGCQIEFRDGTIKYFNKEIDMLTFLVEFNKDKI